eukprot:CAMPEP_0206584774 /NCGR_PEP_ID=MMETSP0325_2-20121206/35964_1 /ASSEMBLY_ACC=CAM_ASM_000347 /TAXON_ID=2866 /ORGANISM="Crypthecodinium cohnii, Strain Seligo" /LENGTH=309 /DNA_ID=CAMNT_0054092079 /DNA_START=37 /DNA_END=963 /DNA_ORIENTATION=-
MSVLLWKPRGHHSRLLVWSSAAIGKIGRRHVSGGSHTPAAMDIERYPLHDESRCLDILQRCRGDISTRGYCHLPGFLRPEVIPELIGEAEHAESSKLGFRSSEAHNVFLESGPTPISASSASLQTPTPLREKEFESSKLLVAMDDMSPDSKLLELYRWGPLRKFLQSVFQLPALYNSGDPMGGVYYNIYDCSFKDALGWHFDRSAFSMNLILQTADGGEFQYWPNSREAVSHMTTWDEVESRLDVNVETPDLFPGSLYLFAGNRSLHQVTEVTSGRRINAIFTYVENEGDRLNEYTLRKFFGRTEPRRQ